METTLAEIIAERTARPVPEEISTFAAALREGFSGNVAAVLAYGSCLRDTSVSESLIDFYLVTGSANDCSGSALSRTACRIVPPNVYYAEHDIDGQKLRCKYAVVDMKTFGNWVSPQTRNPYFWARFAQPVAVVWAANDAVRNEMISHLGTAVMTMLAHARKTSPGENDIAVLWQKGFQQTYTTELRAEGKQRASNLVAHNLDYYEQISRVAPTVEVHNNWTLARIQGKALAVLRLIKAAFTFTGGADYLAWKINRHSGTEIKLKPWQRRHPILAALYLLPSLLRKGAVR